MRTGNSKAISAILFLSTCLINYPAETIKAAPIGAAFTYQGRLADSNFAADGLYDFQFRLYDANAAGNQVGNDINKPDVNVIDGYFTVELDFGSSVFDGNERWLEIGVRPAETDDPNYIVLSPRQKVAPTPYALQMRGIFVDDTGNVGIGTTSPEQKLHIVGNVKIIDGGQGEGKVLTSDSTGKASWQTITSGLKVYDSGWFAVTAATSYTKTHDLGTNKVIIELWFSSSSDGTNASKVTFTASPEGGDNSSWTSYVYNLTPTQISIQTSKQTVQLGYDSDGTLSSGLDTGYYRLLMLALE